MPPVAEPRTRVLLARPANECLAEEHFRGLSRRSLVPPWKRLLDISCIVMALPILAPMALLIAVGIKLVSRGPVLFKQERVGLQGRRFLCLKFRTMRVNADTTIHQGHLNRLMSADCPMTKLD